MLCSPGTANSRAHTTIDVQRHTGGLPYGSFSGPYNTVGGDVSAYNTVCVRVAAEYCFVQGMVPDIVVLTCEPCLALPFSARLLVPTERDTPGRMAPVGFECAGWRRAVSRVPMSPGRRVRVMGSE